MKMNRRDFLKLAGVAGAALVAVIGCDPVVALGVNADVPGGGKYITIKQLRAIRKESENNQRDYGERRLYRYAMADCVFTGFRK